MLIMKKESISLMLVITAVIAVCAGASYWAFLHVMEAETNARYVGLQNTISAKVEKTINVMETNAKNVFDEVGESLSSPDAVIEALKRKTEFAPDVRGYFAAFEPEYFKEKGRWFEPYVHRSADSDGYKLSMVGSARHDYTKSSWYVSAKKKKGGFWSDPYYYYDGSEISGHYCTYVEPVYDADGKLACVCGADMTFSWLTDELKRIDSQYKDNEALNRFRVMRDLDFYSVIVDKDGSSIVYPGTKKVSVKDNEILRSMAEKKRGVLQMPIDGVPSTLYYGPIEGMNWTLMVITPTQDIEKPKMYVGVMLLMVVVLGIFAAWVICRRIRYAEDKQV